MRTTILKFCVLLLLIHASIGCNPKKDLEENNPDTFLTRLKSASSAIQAKGNYSGWILKKITEIETLNSKDISIIKIKVFQGEWNNRSVYFIYNNLASCVYCEVYYEDGEKIVWTTEYIADNFRATSKNWKLIYEYGNALFFQ